MNRNGRARSAVLYTALRTQKQARTAGLLFLLRAK